MRLFVGGIATETNSFAPVPTGMQAFGALGIRRGGDRSANPAAVALMLDAIHETAVASDVEVVEGLFAAAQPSGPVVAAAYRSLRAELLDDLAAARADAVVLVLHGAMIAEGCDDCEGDILDAASAIVGAGVPIGVVCDPHCHFTARMAATANVIACFHDYPHTDTAERAAQVCRLTLAVARGEIAPRLGVAGCRMVGLWPTTEEPGRSLVALMQAMERRPGVLSVSFGHGFPWGDAREAGATCWALTDGDASLAQAIARELADAVWAARAGALPALVSIDEGLAAIAGEAPGPIVLADMADNPGGGAPGDSSFILARLAASGLDRVVLGCLWDPHAVQICRAAGVGATLELRVGGKAGRLSGAPVDLIVTVMALAEAHGQTGFGIWLPFGPAAWVRAANELDIVLVSERQQVLGPDAFTALGVPLDDRRAIVVKSAQHFQAGFAGIAAGVVRVNTPGALDHDFASLPYRKRDLDYWPRVAHPTGIAA